MIKLDVEPYCHDCPVFEAEQNKIEFYSDSCLGNAGDCIISCEHKNICNRINEYLNSVIKIKELNNESKTDM